jgi:alanine dehydrogenase
MIVGVLREVKSDEYRVGLLPVGAELLVRDGHTVLVETVAGYGSGF